jgi:hypothetical protein
MRSALIYLGLVGGPILGLLGILEAGKRLVPPPSIGGVWVVQEPLGGELARCLGPGIRLEIEQSGVRAQVTLDSLRTVVNVELRADSIAGLGPAPAGGGCPGGTLSLRAKLEGDGAMPREMTGALALADCPACSPATFRASRLPRPR